MKVLLLFTLSFLIMPLAFTQNVNEATEPSVISTGVIDLLKGGTLEAWKVPSARWQLKEGVIVGETGNERLSTPEWIYTKQKFSNFEFTCELRLTGDNRRNTGIYFRVTPFTYRDRFEAPSGYEFDAAATGEDGDALLGERGIALPLTGQGGEALVAHVLPLSSSFRRQVGGDHAARIALFVQRAELHIETAPEALIRAYQLTPAELRVLLAIVEIGGAPEVAEALGISETTVKFHLRRLYDKTGSRRHADLVKLVAGFASPASV